MKDYRDDFRDDCRWHSFDCQDSLRPKAGSILMRYVTPIVATQQTIVQRKKFW